MPNRIIKESITTSRTLHEQLDDFELGFFFMLLVVCDDFGRFFAEPDLVRNRCFPVRESATRERVAKALARFEEVGLIKTYRVKDRIYLESTSWRSHQNVRAKESKFPDPPWTTRVEATAQVAMPLEAPKEEHTQYVEKYRELKRDPQAQLSPKARERLTAALQVRPMATLLEALEGLQRDAKWGATLDIAAGLTEANIQLGLNLARAKPPPSRYGRVDPDEDRRPRPPLVTDARAYLNLAPPMTPEEIRQSLANRPMPDFSPPPGLNVEPAFDFSKPPPLPFAPEVDMSELQLI